MICTGRNCKPGPAGSRLCLLLIVATALLAKSQETATDEADKRSKYARQISEAKNSIFGRTEELRWLAQDFESLGDWGRSDYNILTNDYARIVSEWEVILGRLRAGDSEQARGLREASKPRPDRDWKKRAEARRRQSDLWPSEQWAHEVERIWGGARARAYAPQWIAARRKASMAWGRLAEAIKPGLEREVYIRLEESSHEIEARVKVTETIWRMKTTQDQMLADPKGNSPSVFALVKEMEGMEAELMQISRERLRIEKQQRDWDRRRKLKEEEMTRAHQQAERERPR
jgi:hypothetical protein